MRNGRSRPPAAVYGASGPTGARSGRDWRRMIGGVLVGYSTVDFIRSVRQERSSARQLQEDVGEMRWVAISPDWSVPHSKALSPERAAELLSSDQYRGALIGLPESYRDQPIHDG